MKQVIRHKYFQILVALLIVDALFFSFTNPSRVLSIFLVVGYGLVVATTYGLLRVVFMLVGFFRSRLGGQRHLAGSITAVVALLLGLQSIGQLTLRDGFVAALLAVMLYLYFVFIRVRPVK